MYIKYPVKHALRNNMFQLWHCSVSMVITNRSSAACVRLDFCLTQLKKGKSVSARVTYHIKVGRDGFLTFTLITKVKHDSSFKN